MYPTNPGEGLAWIFGIICFVLLLSAVLQFLIALWPLWIIVGAVMYWKNR